MATFIKGVTDEFPQQNLYKPDYSFLTQVYGTRQAEYDRGFDYVKNIINSALNSPLTSASNEEYRKELFKKIQGSLKDITNLDLSNPANISIANSLVDPITKDKELARDMALTKYYSTEIGKYNSMKESDDIKVRAQASDYSLAYMNQGISELKSSKRGDGSILKAQPKNFVKFADMDNFVQERMKELKFERVVDKVTGLYKETITNGKGTEMSFAKFYKDQVQQFGGFNEQLGVIGAVDSENAIQEEMTTSKVSREQAIQSISNKLITPVKEQAVKTQDESVSQLDDIKEKIELFDREHPDGIPVTKKEYYDNLVNTKTALEKDTANAVKDNKDIDTGGANHIVSNLQNLFKNNALNSRAIKWGTDYATLTAKYEIDENKVGLELYKIQADKQMAFAKMNNDNFMKNKELAQQKTIADNNLEFEYKKAAASGAISSSHIISTKQTDLAMPAIQVLSQALTSSHNEIFADAFDPKEGAINLVVGSQNTGQYYSVMDKVKRIAENDGTKGIEKLTGLELKLLGKLGGLSKVQVYEPTTPELARAMINSLAVGIHEKAKKLIPVLAAQGSIGDYKQHVYVMNNAISKFDQALSQQNQINLNYKKIAETILDSKGHIREFYQGKVTAIGHTSDGYPIFDTSKLNSTELAGITKNITAEYQKKTTGTTVTRLNTGVGADEWGLFFSNVAAANTSDPGLFTQLKSMNNESRSKLLGNQYEVSSDPVSKTVQVTLRSNNEDPKKSNAPLIVKIPYNTIYTNPALGTLKKYARESEINVNSLGDFSKLQENPTATITANRITKGTGFDFSATGVYDRYGSYSISYNTSYFDPQKNQMVNSGVNFIPAKGPDDVDAILALDLSIRNEHEGYMVALKHMNDAKKKNVIKK